jgi:hypothetical protein
MALPKLASTFANTMKINGVDDESSYLYLETNNTGRLVLTPNVDAVFTPVPSPPPIGTGNFDPGGSVVYFQAFTQIMDADAVAAMQFGDDWTAQYYADDGAGYWAVSPKAQTKVSANQPLDVPVSNIVVSDGRGLPSFTAVAAYYDISGLNGPGSAHFIVALHKAPGAPSQGKLSDYVSCSFSTGYEIDYAGYQNIELIRTTQDGESVTDNRFSINLAPLLGQPTIQVTDATQFFLSFPVADGPFGALASPVDLSQIRITSAYGWDIVPVLDGSQPFWRITIPTGRPISGLLALDTVVTHLEVGFSEALLQYKAVPGCEDGAFKLPIYKYGATTADGFALRHVTKAGAYLSGQVGWNLENVTRVVITVGGSKVVDTTDMRGSIQMPFSVGYGAVAVISGCPMDPDPAKRVLTELKRISFITLTGSH